MTSLQSILSQELFVILIVKGISTRHQIKGLNTTQTELPSKDVFTPVKLTV